MEIKEYIEKVTSNLNNEGSVQLDIGISVSGFKLVVDPESSNRIKFTIVNPIEAKNEE